MIYRLNFTKDKADYSKLEELYNSVLVPSFPNTNILESLDNIKAQIERMQDDFCILVAIQDDKIVGGLLGDYFHTIGSAMIEYIAVAPEHRSKGIATELINAFILPTTIYTFGEVGREDKSAQEFCLSRGFGFLKDFDYVQPQLEEGKAFVPDLCLAVKVCRDDTQHKITGSFLMLFLKLYFERAFKLEYSLAPSYLSCPDK